MSLSKQKTMLEKRGEKPEETPKSDIWWD